MASVSNDFRRHRTGWIPEVDQMASVSTLDGLDLELVGSFERL